jgi:hypothetical protein
MSSEEAVEAGKELAHVLDVDAVKTEAGGTSKDALKEELIKSFSVEFRENHENIQHQLLKSVIKDLHTLPVDEPVSKTQLRNEGQYEIRYAALGYLNYGLSQIGLTGRCVLSEIPKRSELDLQFRDGVVDALHSDAEWNAVNEPVT